MERLLTPDSIPELAMRRCVLGKDTLRSFPIGAKQYPLWWSSLTKKVQQEPKKSAVRWCGYYFSYLTTFANTPFCWLFRFAVVRNKTQEKSTKKAPLKPSFKAPRCKTSSLASETSTFLHIEAPQQLHSSPLFAVVPSASPDPQPIEFDSDVYTMKLSGWVMTVMRYWFVKRKHHTPRSYDPVQNPERTKSRIGQNLKWKKSWIGLNPKWTKSRTDRIPNQTKPWMDKIQNGQNPKRT